MAQLIEKQNLSQLTPSQDVWQLLDAMMTGVSEEVYAIDAISMRFDYANVTALKNTGCSLDALKQQDLKTVLGVDEKTFQTYLSLHRHNVEFTLLKSDAPISKQIHHAHLRAMVVTLEKKELIIVIKNPHALVPVVSCSNCQIVENPELCEIEARFHAMVSNIPGLFFQFQLDADAVIKFIYVSEGCRALLGITAEELKSNADLLYALMNANDRAMLNKRLVVSRSKLSALDWEGRVWIDNWQDNKWINIRAIPRTLNDGAIQWEGIMINITQSKNEKHEIEQSRRELAELSAHMNKIKEHERTAIAREIHDDLGGNLTAIKIGLAAVIKRLVSGEAVSVKQVNDLEFIIDNTFEAVHRISSDLRPNILDLGIVAALEWQAIEFEKLVAIPCKFKSNHAEISVTQEQAITLFRICQESMANIAKHAEASKVRVDLTLNLNEIVLKISDNGVGIKSGDTYKANSFGLRGMQERVTALNGTLQIDQLNKSGTAIIIKLPIK